jgi:hypothetical protein
VAGQAVETPVWVGADEKDTTPSGELGSRVNVLGTKEPYIPSETALGRDGPGGAVLAAGDRGGVDHYGVAVLDELTERYGDLLTGSYDCVDRIVLNAYFSLGHNPGGFRVWWRRWHDDSDEELDRQHGQTTRI